MKRVIVVLGLIILVSACNEYVPASKPDDNCDVRVVSYRKFLGSNSWGNMENHYLCVYSENKDVILSGKKN